LLPQKNAELLRNKNYTHYHLGCNQILIKGWLNIDFLMNSPSPVGEFYSEPLSPDNKNFFLNWDLTKGFPADRNTLDCVYHSHFLEHLTYRDGIRLLQEIYDALKIGGRHRIVVPDLEVYCRAYLDAKNKFLFDYQSAELAIQSKIYETKGSIFVSQFYEHGHKMGWDFETLSMVLKKVGFKNIRKMECREGDFPDVQKLEICDPFRVAESMFVECEK
jgi:predicted SAM-dependent methyltransferase